METAYNILKKRLSRGPHGKYCAELLLSEDLTKQVKYIEHLIEVCNIIVAHSHLQGSRICLEHDALTLLKMVSSKLSVIRKILKEPDVTFDGIMGDRYISHKIIDHVTLYAVIRTLFESLCVFELIYVFPKSKKEQELVYNLYQLAGINEQYKIMPDGEKFKEEKERVAEEIQIDIKAIKESAFYADDKNKAVLDKCIDKGNFNIKIDNGRVIPIQGYINTIQEIGFKPNYIHGIYKYLCLNAHQTCIALTQFHDACELYNPHAIQLSITASRLTINFASVFIVDFVKKNEELVDVFNRFEDYIQYLVDAPNAVFRGQQYSLVNYCGKPLN